MPEIDRQRNTPTPTGSRPFPSPLTKAHPLLCGLVHHPPGTHAPLPHIVGAPPVVPVRASPGALPSGVRVPRPCPRPHGGQPRTRSAGTAVPALPPTRATSTPGPSGPEVGSCLVRFLPWPRDHLNGGTPAGDDCRCARQVPGQRPRAVGCPRFPPGRWVPGGGCDQDIGPGGGRQHASAEPVPVPQQPDVLLPGSSARRQWLRVRSSASSRTSATAPARVSDSTARAVAACVSVPAMAAAFRSAIRTAVNDRAAPAPPPRPRRPAPFPVPSPGSGRVHRGRPVGLLRPCCFRWATPGVAGGCPAGVRCRPADPFDRFLYGVAGSHGARP